AADRRARAAARAGLLRQLAPDGCGDGPVALDAGVSPLLGRTRGDVPGVGVAGAVPPELHTPRRRAVDSPPGSRVAGVRAAEAPQGRGGLARDRRCPPACQVHAALTSR